LNPEDLSPLNELYRITAQLWGAKKPVLHTIKIEADVGVVNVGTTYTRDGTIISLELPYYIEKCVCQGMTYILGVVTGETDVRTLRLNRDLGDI